MEELLGSYKDILEKVLTNATELKKNICNFMCFEETYKRIDSVLFSKEESQRKEQEDFLMKALNQPKKVTKIFQASEHNFASSAFHKICDEKKDTLVIVKTEFLKIVGGFTHYAWKSANNENVCDGEKKSFIFSLNLMEKFSPVSGKNLLCLRKDWGPMFGYNGDLWIADQCHNNKNSLVQFP